LTGRFTGDRSGSQLTLRFPPIQKRLRISTPDAVAGFFREVPRFKESVYFAEGKRVQGINGAAVDRFQDSAGDRRRLPVIIPGIGPSLLLFG